MVVNPLSLSPEHQTRCTGTRCGAGAPGVLLSSPRAGLSKCAMWAPLLISCCKLLCYSASLGESHESVIQADADGRDRSESLSARSAALQQRWHDYRQEKARLRWDIEAINNDDANTEPDTPATATSSMPHEGDPVEALLITMCV